MNNNINDLTEINEILNILTIQSQRISILKEKTDELKEIFQKKYNEMCKELENKSCSPQV